VQNLSEVFRDLGNAQQSPADRYIENTRIQLLGCGIRETAVPEIQNFMLPAFLAVSYQAGSVQLRHGAQTIVLKPGSFYIFRPYDIYSGVRIGETPLRFAFLQFDMTPFMERYYFGVDALISDVMFQNPRVRRFGEMLEELAAEDPARDGRSAMLQQFTKHLIAQILYDQFRQSDSLVLLKKGRESRLINHAFAYVAEHLSEPIVIRDILESCGTSKTSLDRAFRNVLGATPQRALLRFKIERSMEMLQQNLPLKSIVKALGFSSVYHFSNTFKAVTGVRPTAYRDGISPGTGPRELPRKPDDTAP
jgi:AraC-like DNA-binding protein